jgi:hypothetical protein
MDLTALAEVAPYGPLSHGAARRRVTEAIDNTLPEVPS